MTATVAGTILVVVLWMVVLVPVIHGIVRFILTTRISDLVPRLIRVKPGTGPVLVVSGQRAHFDPEHWEKVSPWCWRRKEEG